MRHGKLRLLPHAVADNLGGPAFVSKKTDRCCDSIIYNFVLISSLALKMFHSGCVSLDVQKYLGCETSFPTWISFRTLRPKSDVRSEQ